MNGVAYDSVHAMPAEVRRVYEETLAKFPLLADRDGDGVPDVVEDEMGPLKFTTTVRKQFIVNGTPYDDEAAMPPDVREVYRKAIREAGTSEPTVKQSEIKMSLQFTDAPGLDFGAPESPRGAQEPTPLERAAAESRLRWLLIAVGACVMTGVTLWLLAGNR